MGRPTEWIVFEQSRWCA